MGLVQVRERFFQGRYPGRQLIAFRTQLLASHLGLLQLVAHRTELLIQRQQAVGALAHLLLQDDSLLLLTRKVQFGLLNHPLEPGEAGLQSGLNLGGAWDLRPH
jgi:hypothetical protein